MYKSLKLSCLLLLITLFFGCTAQENSYEQDGYLGMTNTFPNLNTNAGHHNYRVDSELMKSILQNNHKISDSSILINGANAYIRIKISSTLSKAEQEKLADDVIQELSFQVPRYQYFLEVDI